MDVNLLKRFDLNQDVNSLYKEVLKNCKNRGWYWHTPSNRWKCIDSLDIDNRVSHATGDYIICVGKNDRWILYKWMYNS